MRSHDSLLLQLILEYLLANFLISSTLKNK
jgi:hypothetical protein